MSFNPLANYLPRFGGEVAALDTWTRSIPGKRLAL
jgi:hypothetical protein